MILEKPAWVSSFNQQARIAVPLPAVELKAPVGVVGAGAIAPDRDQPLGQPGRGERRPVVVLPRFGEAQCRAKIFDPTFGIIELQQVPANRQGERGTLGCGRLVRMVERSRQVSRPLERLGVGGPQLGIVGGAQGCRDLAENSGGPTEFERRREQPAQSGGIGSLARFQTRQQLEKPFKAAKGPQIVVTYVQHFADPTRIPLDGELQRLQPFAVADQMIHQRLVAGVGQRLSVRGGGAARARGSGPPEEASQVLKDCIETAAGSVEKGIEVGLGNAVGHQRSGLWATRSQLGRSQHQRSGRKGKAEVQALCLKHHLDTVPLKLEQRCSEVRSVVGAAQHHRQRCQETALGRHNRETVAERHAGAEQGSTQRPGDRLRKTVALCHRIPLLTWAEFDPHHGGVRLLGRRQSEGSAPVTIVEQQHRPPMRWQYGEPILYPRPWIDIDPRIHRRPFSGGTAIPIQL